MAEERTRYSDAELAEFKELILKKLEKCGHFSMILDDY